MTDIAMDGDDLFDGAINLESGFYETGYAEGHAHGQLHGLFEGRQLGQEKAWELWEEVGFYEGFAGVWCAKLASSSSRKEAKSLAHAQTLLGLITAFPATNPTPVPDAPLDNDTPELAAAREAAAAAAPDLPAMLSAIRARYRLLCTSLGTRPRLVTAAKDGTDGAGEGAGVVEGIEGPMKGVDTRQLRF
ncbi:Oral cancer-overexpressed protein 1 [Vanrija pseudolonga]|uniref:Oral cancer-overexpressed protein 1 n=1 Tax=Vanrija pseudolonga TaxID=143232 RepID=A0AAF0YH29_9TREE|nr:Oral cancer-overexpressed protein 1 [Vanrija pseudolonga]